MKFFVFALFVAAAVAIPVPEDKNGDAIELIVNGVPEGSPLELGGIVDMHLNEHVNGQLAASTNLLHPYTAVGIAEAAAIAAAEENAPTPIQIVEQPEADFHIVPDAIVLPEPEVAQPEIVFPTPVLIPSPVVPEVESVVLPEPVPPMVVPEVESVALPAPAPPMVVPEVESVVLPAPAPPMVSPEVESVFLPAPAPPMLVPEVEAVFLPAPAPPMVVPEVESVVVPAPAPLPEPAAQGPNEIYNDGLVQVQVNAPEDAGMFTTLQNWFSLVVNYISNGIQTSQQIV